MGSHHRPKVPQRPTSTREKTEEEISMSSFPLNKPPVQRTQDSPPHGLASWLPLVCSPSQEARTSSSSNKQDLRLRDKRVKPMMEQTLQLGVSLSTNHLLEHPNNLEVTLVATPAVLPTPLSSACPCP